MLGTVLRIVMFRIAHELANATPFVVQVACSWGQPNVHLAWSEPQAGGSPVVACLHLKQISSDIGA